MSSFFKTLKEQGFALIYIDDVLFLSISKERMFHFIEQFHYISTKHNLKLAPEISMVLNGKFLELENGYNTIKTIHSKVDAIHKIHSPTGKVALMSFIGAANFYTKVIGKFHLNLNLLMIYYKKILRGHGLLNMKLDTELTKPKTKHPFSILLMSH